MSLSQPTPPNPATSANIQTAYNNANMVTDMVGNNVNQSTPFGSLNYAYGPVGPNGVPFQTANQTLNAPTQNLLNQYQGNQQNLGGIGGQIGQAAGAQTPQMANNYAGIGQLGSQLTGAAGTLANNLGSSLTNAPNFLSQSSPQVQAQMAAYQGYMAPFYQMQNSNLNSMLQNQGIGQGSTAWNNAQMGLDTSQNQGAQSALMNFEPQAFNQAVTNYALPIQTLGGLASSGAGLTGQAASGLEGLLGTGGSLAAFGAPPGLNSTFTQTPLNGTAQPANYQGAAQAQYNAQQNQFQNTVGDLGTLGSGLLSGVGGLSGIGAGIGGLFGLGGIDPFPGGTFEGRVPST